MSVSEREVEEKKYNWLYFHGKDVRTKKFQKKINKRPTLAYAIIINTAVILSIILTIWILASLVG
ncbi:MAG: hypothetical protein HWN80_03505 [Candidatus Lokiarchaeota archaeon]|nr:hypothetical protein [Candidatus Lokiarchaeota archaeon]